MCSLTVSGVLYEAQFNSSGPVFHVSVAEDGAQSKVVLLL